MFYTRQDSIQMNRQYSEPDNQYHLYESALNDEEISLVQKRVAKIIATYVKNNKKRVLKLLKKHRVKTGQTDSEIVSSLVQMMLYGNKDFKEDLIQDLSEISLKEVYGENEKQLKNSSSLDPITISAIIGGVTALIKGGVDLAGKSQDKKLQEQELKQQILTYMTEEKARKSELEKSRNRNVMIAIVVIIVVLITGIVLYQRFNKSKNK